MVYLGYEKCRLRYEHAQEIYNEILNEQEELITRLLPQGIRYNTDKVQSSNISDGLAEYMIKKEQTHLDEKLKEAEAFVEKRAKQLKRKMRELQESNDIQDKVYLKRYVYQVKVQRIAEEEHYSISQIYRMLKDIEVEIRTNCIFEYAKICE